MATSHHAVLRRPDEFLKASRVGPVQQSDRGQMALDRIIDLLRLGLMRRKPDVITLADRARDAGQWGLAAQLYRKALARNSRHPPIWVQYGHALKESGELRDPDKLAQAELAYRRALSLDPGLADTYLQLGHVLKLQGKTDDARSAYLRAIALDPSTAHPLDELRGLGWSEAQISELLTLVELGGAEAQHSDRQDGPTADLAVSHAAEIRESSLLPIYNDEGELPSLERNIDWTKVPNNRRITISLLTFSQFDRCVTLVSQLCDWLADNALSLCVRGHKMW
jgi:tetratricopeptide (TPR) repeat protein